MHQYVVYTGACLVVVKGNKCAQLFFSLTTPTQGYTNKCAFGVSVAAYQHRSLPIGSRTQLCWLLLG